MTKKVCTRPNGFKNGWGFNDDFGKLVSIAEQNRTAVEDKIEEVKESDKVVKAGKFVKKGNNVDLELKVANSKDTIKIDATVLNETQAVNAEKARAQKAEQANAKAIKVVDNKVKAVESSAVNTAVAKSKAFTTSAVASAKAEDKAYADSKDAQVKSYADSKDAQVKADAKSYADDKFVEAKSYADEKLNDAKVYADEKASEANDYTDAQVVSAKVYADAQDDAIKAEMLKEITIHTKNGVEQVVEVKNGKAKINIGQMNYYHNGTFVRSFAPGLGGSKSSEDGKSYGSFALNFADGEHTKVSLESENNIPTLKVNFDYEDLLNLKNALICDKDDNFDETTGETTTSTTPSGNEVLRFVFKKAENEYLHVDVDCESLLTEAEAGDGLFVSTEGGHKLSVKAADDTILVGEDGIKVNPDVLQSEQIIVKFEDDGIPSGEMTDDIVKQLVQDIGYDDASKGYVRLYRSTNNISEEVASSYEIAVEAFKNDKSVIGYIQLGEKNYVKVECMSYSEEDYILRLFGHTGSVGSEYDGSKYGGYDSLSPLENYVEVMLMDKVTDEDNQYLFDTLVLFRPLQGTAIDAQFIDWTDAELEEAGIKGVHDASILNKFFDTTTISGAFAAAFFRFGESYQAVKTDVSYDRILEAFSEGRSFHAVIPSLGDSKYQEMLSSGIMLTPVTVTKDYCTFLGEGVLGKYELVMFNNTESGGNHGYQTYGFLMSNLPNYGRKIFDIEHRDSDDCIEGDVMGDIYDVELSLREPILKSTDGRLYRCIGTEKVDGVKRVNFFTSYLENGEVINDYYTLVDETFEVGTKTYTKLIHNTVNPLQGNFYIDFTTDDDAEFDEETIKRLELEYFVDETSLAAYTALKTDVTLDMITEAYNNNRSIYARIMDEGEPIRLYEAMSITTDDEGKATLVHFYGHAYYEEIDNYVEIAMDADNAIMGIRPLAPTPAYITILKIKDGDLTEKQREEKAKNEYLEYYKFKEDSMNVRKLYSLWESGRDTYILIDSNSDALIKLNIPMLFKLDTPWHINNNNIYMTYVCHNMLGFHEVVIQLSQENGNDVETISGQTVPYVIKSDMDEALAERDEKIEELENKLSYAEQAFEEVNEEINYLKTGKIKIVNQNDWEGAEYDTLTFVNPSNGNEFFTVPRDETGMLLEALLPDNRQILVNTNAITVNGQTMSHEENDASLAGVPYWLFTIPSGVAKIILRVWDY